MRNSMLIAVLFLLSYGVKAQGSLGFTTHATPGLADTLIKGSNITYGVTVMNTGNQPVVSNYTVYIAVWDTTFMFPDIVDSIDIANNSLQPGDSSQVTITHNVDPLKFMDGNNTVVIWPAAPGYQTTDTIFKDVFVIQFENTDELAVSQLIVYPNPATDLLYIRTDFKVESVRILDLNGKEFISSRECVLDLSDFENGLYMIEVKTSDEKYLRKKVLLVR